MNIQQSNSEPDTSWYLGLRSKPSYAFFVLMLFLGLIFIRQFLIGPLLMLPVWYLIERFRPTRRIGGGGLIRNRTKAAMSAIMMVMLAYMIRLYVESAQIAQYNLPAQLAGFGSPFGSGAQQKATIAFYSLLVAAGLGYQAYLARRAQKFQWMWILGCFAVAYLPFFHFYLGPLWVLVDFVLILVLAISIFAFRLPQEWPESSPPPLWPPRQAPASLEAELLSLKRLLDQGLLNQEEHDAQKQIVLRKHSAD